VLASRTGVGFGFPWRTRLSELVLVASACVRSRGRWALKNDEARMPIPHELPIAQPPSDSCEVAGVLQRWHPRMPREELVVSYEFIEAAGDSCSRPRRSVYPCGQNHPFRPGEIRQAASVE